MFERKIYQHLLAWKNSRRHKALLLYGPRQVGKSFIIRTLAQQEYRSYVEINLFEDRSARRALAGAADAQDLVSRISLYANEPLIPGESLVFIDEIQELPDIMTMAKFLAEDGCFDYAFSGSMLGTEFKDVRSYPVGSVHELMMHPLDFEEFCWATGIESEHLARARSAIAHEQPVPSYLHDALLARFRTYVVIGGMPEVVQRYVEGNGNLGPAREHQQALNVQYQHDIAKYAGAHALDVRAIFDKIPIQLAEKNQRFKVASLGANGRYEGYEQDFLWLTNAGVGIKVDQVNEPKTPLKRTERASMFKLYQSDTGMLVSRYPQATARFVYLDERSANLGGIFENVVAQELVAQGLHPYYYMAKKRGEVDFIIEGERGPLPIEVKSGRTYRQHSSLDALMASSEYAINRGLVLSRSNVMREGNISYLPLYAAGFIHELFCVEPEMPKMSIGGIS